MAFSLPTKSRHRQRFRKSARSCAKNLNPRCSDDALIPHPLSFILVQHPTPHLGRHQVALERLAQFGREPVPDTLVLPLVTTLGGTAREYPHERVRHRAADFSRVLIARQLQRPASASDDAGRLLEHLVRLAPQDRLLSRDANRYL